MGVGVGKKRVLTNCGLDFFHCRGHVPHRREKLNSNQGEALLFFLHLSLQNNMEESFSFNI